MKLSDLVRPDRVVLPLEATSLAEAAWALIERLVATGAVEDPEKLLSRVAEARGEDIVALGDRAFLTHYRTDAVSDLAVAIGISPTPIRRELTDAETQSARIVLVILAPPRMAARYLQVLGAFARLLGTPEMRDAMLATTSPEELVSLAALSSQVLPEQLAVRDVMTEHPRTTRPDTPLREAALHMAYADVGALPVIEADGLLVGLLGEKELLSHLTSRYLVAGAARRPATAGVSGRRTVRDIMTRQVLCVSPEQPLAEVASLMTNKDVVGVPVVREGRVIGFLTRSDIIRKLIGS